MSEIQSLEQIPGMIERLKDWVEDNPDEPLPLGMMSSLLVAIEILTAEVVDLKNR